jgi:predicted  nucleic acid-binding Zn-ribbon protein
VGAALQSEIAEMEHSRHAAAAATGHDILTRYEAVRESKGDIGVGKLQGETCSACRMTLPAERVRQLSMGDDIGVCPQCRRLIVVRSETAG